MTWLKFSNFNMTDANYQLLAQAIRDQRIIINEEQGKALISRNGTDYQVPLGMRDYLRKNGYEILYFDFPDIQANLVSESPFERRVRDIVGKALEGTEVDLRALHYGQSEPPEAAVTLDFAARHGAQISRLDVGLGFVDGTQVKVLEMKVRDYVMQQKRAR